MVDLNVYNDNITVKRNKDLFRVLQARGRLYQARLVYMAVKLKIESKSIDSFNNQTKSFEP
jgi:hypothetical protein